MSKSICNRRATQPPARFQRNPLGRGRLAVFPRCSFGPYQFGYGRFARALTHLFSIVSALSSDTTHRRTSRIKLVRFNDGA